MIPCRTLLFLGLLCVVSPVWALTTDPTVGPTVLAPSTAPLTPSPVDASMSGALVRLFGAFTLVIGLFLGAVWLWRQWQRTAGAGGRWGRLQVLEARSLGNRQSIFVVGYENERLLLGSSPQGVTLLTRLPEAAEDLDRVPAQSPAVGKLAEILTGVLNSRR